MMGMHLVQGLDFGVVQGSDIFHWGCSLSIGWTKAHWDISKDSTHRSGAILSASNGISYQNLCPGTYDCWPRQHHCLLRLSRAGPGYVSGGTRRAASPGALHGARAVGTNQRARKSS